MFIELVSEETIWFPPQQSAQQAMRNRAKMVVSGVVEKPILGILTDPNDMNSAIDLTDCPLYPIEFKQIFAQLKDFIARAGLVPITWRSVKAKVKISIADTKRI